MDNREVMTGGRQVRNELTSISRVGVSHGRMFSSMGLAMKGGMLAGAAGALMAGKAILDYSSQMQLATASYKSFLGSAKLANEEIRWSQKYAARSPFDVAGVQKTELAFLGTGMAAKQARDMVNAVAVATAKAGGGKDRLEGISTALTQIQLKGKVSAEEVMQLAERGVPAWKILADAMHKPIPEVMKLSQQGLIPASVAMKAFTGYAGKNQGVLKDQSKTWEGATSTIKDSVMTLLSKGFRPVFDAMTKGAVIVGDFLSGLADGSNKAKGPVLVVMRVVHDFATRVRWVVAWVVLLWRQHSAEIKDTFGQVKRTITDVITAVAAIIKTVMGWISAFWHRWGRDIFATVSRNFSAVLQIIRGVFQIIGGLFKLVSDIMHGHWKKAWDDVKQILRGALNIVVGVLRIAWNNVKLLFSILWDSVKKIWGAIWDGIKSATRKGADATLGLIKGIKDKIVDFFKNAGTWLVGVGKDIINGLKSGAKWVIDRIGSFLGTIKDAIVGGIKRLFHIGSPAGVMVPLGVNIIQGLIKGLVTSQGSLGKVLSTIGGGALSTLKGFFTGLWGGISGPAAAGAGAKNIVDMAKQMVTAWFGAGQWPPFFNLEMREAGFNPYARNPSSGAFGIPQALPPSKLPAEAFSPRPLVAAFAQLKWMMGYIKQRYVNPAGAWMHEQAFNWYRKGLNAVISKPTLIGVGEAGPEEVNVTPLGRRGPGSGATYNVNVTIPIEHFDGSPEALEKMHEIAYNAVDQALTAILQSKRVS